MQFRQMMSFYCWHIYYLSKNESCKIFTHYHAQFITYFSWKHANYRWKLFNKKSAKNLDKTHVYILRRQANLLGKVGAISVQDLY